MTEGTLKFALLQIHWIYWELMAVKEIQDRLSLTQVTCNRSTRTLVLMHTTHCDVLTPLTNKSHRDVFDNAWFQSGTTVSTPSNTCPFVHRSLADSSSEMHWSFWKRKTTLWLSASPSPPVKSTALICKQTVIWNDECVSFAPVFREKTGPDENALRKPNRYASPQEHRGLHGDSYDNKARH